jgi:glyoxylase-like metal-dependent hydrolase (beta-lactamase superfamily II)
MKHFLIFAFLSFGFLAQAQQNFDTVRIRPLKVSEQIYMLKGSGGNIGVLTGTDGLLMIDAQYAPLSTKISEAIKTLSSNSIRYLVNTHVHMDHTGGNDNFSKQGVTIVAHDRVRERMMKEQVIKRLNKTLPPREKEALPLLTFADRLTFHLNDEEINLFYIDRGHTDGDVIVQFKKANVFHTGDAFVRYGYPFIDASAGGSINGFIRTLNKLLVLMDDQSKVIPGHGDLATKEDVKILRDQITDIRDQVSKALKSGKKVEELASLGITDKYDEKLGKGFVSGKDFVVLVAESLSEK